MKKKTICIIGGGMSGGYLASQLVDKNKYHIVLIDVDNIDKKFEKKRELKINFFINSNNKFFDNVQKGYGFGGTSNLWHGGYTHFDAFDLKKFNNNLKFNISKELKIYYDYIYKYFLRLNIYKEVSKKFIKFFNTLSNEKIFFEKKIFIQKNPYNSRKVIKNLFIKNKITLIEDAVCIKLHQNNTSNKISFIECNKNKKKINVKADIFILAAGSFETPRILLQSIKEKSIQYENKNIGKYLIDHPFCKIYEVTQKLIINKNRIPNKTIFDKNFYLRTGFSYLENFHDKFILNHSMYIRESRSAFVENRIKKIKSCINSNRLIIIKLYNLFKLIINFNLILFLFNKIFNKYSKKFDIYIHFDQIPSKSDSITLSNKFDNFSRNIPNVYIENKFEKSIKNFRFIMDKIFQCKISNLKIKKINKYHFYHGNHHSGSCRMSFSKKDGVVNKNLKVYGIDNLYVCDSSVLPNFGNSNPSLTLLALSKRLSDFL